MAIKVAHNYEVKDGLEITTEGHVKVKPDTTGNVVISVSEAGVKGEVVLPEAFDPSELNEKIAALEQAKSELELKVQQLEAREDIKLQGAELLDTNELKLTTTDGVEIKADLAKFVDAPKSAEEYWSEIKALPTFKQDLLDVLKGEEVQDLSGETKGYLLPLA